MAGVSVSRIYLLAKDLTGFIRSRYMKFMIDGAKSKGATPIISSTTPTNPYETSSTINFTPGRVSPAGLNMPFSFQLNFIRSCSL